MRVDHVSDAVFLPVYDRLNPACWRLSASEVNVSADTWKEEGNSHFNRKHYRQAIEFYSKGLEVSRTAVEGLLIRSNRALAYIRSEQFEDALRDIETLLPHDNVSGTALAQKVLMRKPRALYHLRQFEKSCDAYKALATQCQENNGVKDEFNRAIARLAEQRSGKYPIQKMQHEAVSSAQGMLDYATYVGPVAIQPTKFCGRGLFTTAPVKAGDLLFCEKALVYNPNGNNNELRILLAQKMYKNLSLHSEIAELDHGKYQSVDVSEVDGKPVVDSFLVENVLNKNAFACPRSSRDILRRNMSLGGNVSNKEQTRASGLWILASSISHSCTSNANRSFIGDMMIVRAAQDLAANTEIRIYYQSPMREAADGVPDEERDGVPLRANLKSLRIDELEIRTLIHSIETTYRQPISEVPRVSVAYAYSILVLIQALTCPPGKVIDNAAKTLKSLGYIVEVGPAAEPSLTIRRWGIVAENLVGFWWTLSVGYRQSAPGFSKQLEDYARLTFKIIVGENETFDAMLRQIAEQNRALGFPGLH
ncbi:hypothetical protein BDV19DRAFT_388844 [Aspergillus venezuelensis]